MNFNNVIIGHRDYPKENDMRSDVSLFKGLRVRFEKGELYSLMQKLQKGMSFEELSKISGIKVNGLMSIDKGKTPVGF